MRTIEIQKYRIQKRKYSSNVIEKLDDKSKWIVFLCPTVRKSEGDIFVDELLLHLNKPIKLKFWEIILIQLSKIKK